MGFRIAHDQLYAAGAIKLKNELRVYPVKVVLRSVDEMQDGRIHVYVLSRFMAAYQIACASSEGLLTLGIQNLKLKDALSTQPGSVRYERLKASNEKTLWVSASPSLM